MMTPSAKNPKVTQTHRLWAIVATLFLLLAACEGATTPEPPPATNPPGDGGTEPAPQGRTLTSWTIDPEFSVAGIADPTTRAWYEQVNREIAQERAVQCVPIDTPPEEQENYPASGTTAACSAIKHFVGRALNYHVTALLSLFRLTGDQALLEEVDRVMEIAYSRLRDTDNDGYKNWYYLAEYDKDDFNLKEDSLSHGFVAEVAYVFRKNAAFGTAEHDYGARADQWVAYLRDNFEAKWALQRETSGTEGIPVHYLFHPFMEILRYHVYMAKIFPEDAKYRVMHERLSKIALSDMKIDVTPKGNAFVWAHVVRQWRIPENPGICTTFQMGTYPQQTMLVFMDLALEGYPGFSDTVAMQTLSRTLSESILEPNEVAFLYKDVGGPRNSTLDPVQRKDTIIDGWCFQDASYGSGRGYFRSEGSYLALTWGFLAAFAPEAQTDLESGEIYQTNQRLYGNPAEGETKIKQLDVPAAQAFSRLYVAGGFALAN